MLTQDQIALVLKAMPVLRGADARLLRDLQEQTFFAWVPAGKDVFVEGDEANGITLLISGVVRVYKIGETGREITLYRFGHGESCILTANAILSRRTFPAIATVEKDAEAVVVPAGVFRDWVKRYDIWREFLFGLLSDRLSTVLAVVDEVVFQRMDRRLAALLLARSAAQHPIRMTHQEIAAELGSSREVISRILEDFSRLGLIEPARGTIEVLDFDGLTSRSLA
jgi:CRP/FNR family transcriptional regulator